MPLHGADVDLTQLWNQVNGVAGSPAVTLTSGIFTGNLDVHGNLVDGSQASGVTGVNVALANVGAVTAETVGLQQAAQTLTLTGGYTNQRFALFAQPTLSGAQTITNAATVAIANAPAVAGGATITNPYSLWVQGGNTRTDANVLVGAVGTGFVNPTRGIAIEDGSAPGLRLVRTGQVSSEIYIGTDSRLHIAGTTNITYTIDLPAINNNAEGIGLTFTGNTFTLTGTFATQRNVRFTQATLSGAFTVTNAATASIQGAPIAAGGATITNPYAFWIEAGNTRLDGGLTIGGNPPGIASTIGIGNTTGVGNGVASAMLAPAQSTGSGPASLTANTWIRAFNGTTSGWIPFFV